MEDEKKVEEVEEVVEDKEEITEATENDETETEDTETEDETSEETADEETAGEEIDIVDVISKISQKLDEIETKVAEMLASEAKKQEKLKGFFKPAEGKVEDDEGESGVTTYSDIYKITRK